MGNTNSYDEINGAQGKANNIRLLVEQEKIHPTAEGRRLLSLHYYEHVFRYIEYDNTYNKCKGLIRLPNNERVIGYYNTREKGGFWRTSIFSLDYAADFFLSGYK
jgi:hypothetical protein